MSEQIIHATADAAIHEIHNVICLREKRELMSVLSFHFFIKKRESGACWWYLNNGNFFVIDRLLAKCLNEWTQTILQCTQRYVLWIILTIAHAVHRIQGVMGWPGHSSWVRLKASYGARLQAYIWKYTQHHRSTQRGRTTGVVKGASILAKTQSKHIIDH